MRMRARERAHDLNSNSILEKSGSKNAYLMVEWEKWLIGPSNVFKGGEKVARDGIKIRG